MKASSEMAAPARAPLQRKNQLCRVQRTPHVHSQITVVTITIIIISRLDTPQWTDLGHLGLELELSERLK